MQDEGIRVQLILPMFGCISEVVSDKVELPMRFHLSWDDERIEVQFVKGRYQGVEGIFLVSSMFEEKKRDEFDQVCVFCQAVIALIQQVDVVPNIVHCFDWQTGLIAALLKTVHQNDYKMRSIKTLFTILDGRRQGVFSAEGLPKTGLAWNVFNMHEMEYFGNVCLLKGGIVYADKLSTASTFYREYLFTNEGGEGLEGVFETRRHDFVVEPPLVGIPEDWEQVVDTGIAHAIEQVAGGVAKQVLNSDKPIVGIWGDMTSYGEDEFFETGLNLLKEIDVVLLVMSPEEPSMASILGSNVVFLNQADLSLLGDVLKRIHLWVFPGADNPFYLAPRMALRCGATPVISHISAASLEVEPMDGRGSGGHAFIYYDKGFSSLVGKILLALNLMYFEDSLGGQDAMGYQELEEKSSLKGSYIGVYEAMA